jgi:hypothetical protein
MNRKLTKTDEMLMVAIVGHRNDEYLKKCIIFRCKDDFEKYLREKIKDESSIYARMIKDYHCYMTSNNIESSNWNEFILHVDKNILHIFENFRMDFGIKSGLLMSYVYLHYPNLKFKKIHGTKKMSQVIYVFVDAYYESKYIFCDYLYEISSLIEKELKDYVESKKENIFSANLFKNWSKSAKIDFIKNVFIEDPDKNWFDYYRMNCGNIEMSIIPTKKIRIY